MTPTNTRTQTPIATGGMWIQVAESQIHMLKSEGAHGRANPFGAHLALEVEDFAAARQTLDDQKIAYVEAPDGPPTHQLWLLDPSGNTIELWANRETT